MSDFQHVEYVMGTAAVLDIRNSELDDEAASLVFESINKRLYEIDQSFTTYNATSEVARIGRGELMVEDASSDVRFIIDFCQTLHDTTNGYFDMYEAAKRGPAVEFQASSPNARPIETSGVVKGWAIEQACDIMRREGIRDYCVNIGGDLYASGEYKPGEGWRIGLQHPTEKMKVMAVLEVSDAGIATSGLYERGEHIAGPELPPEKTLTSMTVVGSDITLADAYATAAFAMGIDGIEWIADLAGFEVFGVDHDDMTHFSAGLSALRVDPT